MEKDEALELIDELLVELKAFPTRFSDDTAHVIDRFHRRGKMILAQIGIDVKELAEFNSIRDSFPTHVSPPPVRHPFDDPNDFGGSIHDDQYWYDHTRERTRIFLESLTERIRRFGLSPSAPVSTSALERVLHVLSRVHAVARHLRKRHDGRDTLDVQDEHDLQDLMRSLLAIDFDDVRPEEYTPSYAGKSSRMDFLVKKDEIAIEAKMTRPDLAEKEVGTELIDDIARYRSHPACKTLVCMVYDPAGRILNPAGLETDLSGQRDGLHVRVLVVPKA